MRNKSSINDETYSDLRMWWTVTHSLTVSFGKHSTRTRHHVALSSLQRVRSEMERELWKSEERGVSASDGEREWKMRVTSILVLVPVIFVAVVTSGKTISYQHIWSVWPSGILWSQHFVSFNEYDQLDMLISFWIDCTCYMFLLYFPDSVELMEHL